MLLLTNENVKQVLTMEKCLEAVEESTRRVGRGQLSKWDAGRLLTAQGGFGGGAASSYVLRLRPLFDMVDEVAILRINSWATSEVEREAGYRVASWRLLEQFNSKRVYLTDFIEGRAPGRNNDKEITFSPSPAAQVAPRRYGFAALLPMVYEAAKRGGVGHDLPDDWFQQETETYQMYTLR